MIVSAIPFTGNKRKLWKQIEPLLPNGRVFVDMFLGGGTVVLNVVDRRRGW
jgi:site-specific DNA-adenine methylase